MLTSATVNKKIAFVNTFGNVNKCNGGVFVFFDNFIYFCNKKGISPSAAGEEMGFHRSQISRWANSETLPRRANLMKIADYFGCTVDDLLADSAAFDIQAFAENKNKPSDIGELSEAELSLIQLFRALPEDRRLMVLPMLQAALQAAGLSQEQE